MSASTNRPVAWGVLGVAKIATQKVIPGMQGSPGMEQPQIRVAGIASRDIARAREAAAALGIPKAYGSYEEMLADPEIEASTTRCRTTSTCPGRIKAMEAGKHVLCEKPIALTADEAAALVEARARTGKLVAEAFMIHFHPQWLRAREIVRSGEIGELRSHRDVLFCYNNVDPTNIRNMADIGGGGLYDIGCYAVASSRFIFEAEPQRIVSLLDFDPVLKTDRVSAGLADFGPAASSPSVSRRKPRPTSASRSLARREGSRSRCRSTRSPPARRASWSTMGVTCSAGASVSKNSRHATNTAFKARPSPARSAVRNRSAGPSRMRLRTCGCWTRCSARRSRRNGSAPERGSVDIEPAPSLALRLLNSERPA